MRLRLTMLACALTAFGCVLAPGSAGAAPSHNHHLTIAVVPNPILAGQGVLIFGRLFGDGHAGQAIRLYHHLDGAGRGYSLIGAATTNQFGEYEFTRQEDVVMTNRDWFVRGPDGAHSRTAHERVAALVSEPAVSTTDGDTAHPIVFTGHVTPNHAFGRVYLQKQIASSDDWTPVAVGLIGPSSNYLIVHRFGIPGAYSLRVVFRGDARNIRNASDPVNVIIQQSEVPGFTINTSAPIVDQGGSAIISGVLDQPGTTTPEPGAIVQLWGRHANQPFVVLADATTGPNGSYSFNQSGLTANSVYYVATMRLPHSRRQHTSRLFEGVRDVVTMQPNATSASTGQTVTFRGTVLPDKAGHVVYLQERGSDGDFHTVELGVVQGNSTFQFNWTLGSLGDHTFRARITADENNIGAASIPPVTVTATNPPLPSLPTGS
jgi:hypothetical protein